MNKIEIAYVDDDTIYGSVLDAFFTDGNELIIKFFNSQKEYKNNYMKTADISFLISDFHMKGELNGIDFINRERHKHNYALVVSNDENVCHTCHINGIVFLGKEKLVNYIEGIELGVTCQL